MDKCLHDESICRNAIFCDFLYVFVEQKSIYINEKERTVLEGITIRIGSDVLYSAYSRSTYSLYLGLIISLCETNFYLTLLKKGEFINSLNRARSI